MAHGLPDRGDGQRRWLEQLTQSNGKSMAPTTPAHGQPGGHGSKRQIPSATKKEHVDLPPPRLTLASAVVWLRWDPGLSHSVSDPTGEPAIAP
jgi:hypothetical protein